MPELLIEGKREVVIDWNFLRNFLERFKPPPPPPPPFVKKIVFMGYGHFLEQQHTLLEGYGIHFSSSLNVLVCLFVFLLSLERVALR